LERATRVIVVVVSSASSMQLYIFRSYGYSFFEGIPGPMILRRIDARECRVAIRCASYDIPHRAAPPRPTSATV